MMRHIRQRAHSQSDGSREKKGDIPPVILTPEGVHHIFDASEQYQKRKIRLLFWPAKTMAWAARRLGS